eukprot:2555-Pelagococcus_subviridis.AAC.1
MSYRSSAAPMSSFSDNADISNPSSLTLCTSDTTRGRIARHCALSSAISSALTSCDSGGYDRYGSIPAIMSRRTPTEFAATAMSSLSLATASGEDESTGSASAGGGCSSLALAANAAAMSSS